MHDPLSIDARMSNFYSLSGPIFAPRACTQLVACELGVTGAKFGRRRRLPHGRAGAQFFSGADSADRLTVRRNPFSMNGLLLIRSMFLAGLQAAKAQPGRGLLLASPSRSGVFSKATDRRVEQFTESVSFDRRLYAHDIAGSIAHAQMLADGRPDHRRRVPADLRDAGRRFGRKLRRAAFQFRTELEDIHMHIEQALIDRLGDVGRKLHTARSRNDQVATDLRLWVRDAIDRIDARLVDLQRAFVGRCDARPGRHSAGLHAPAAGPAGAGAALLAGLLREARARPRAAGRLPPAGERVAAWGRRRWPARSLPIDRHDVAERLGFDERGGQQPRCLERSRFRAGIRRSCWR